jgi:hypothetical protein
MKLFFAFTLILAHFQVFSQKHIVNLSDQKLTSKADIRIDNVVDAREDQDCIGVVYKKLNNKNTLAYLDRPASESFQQLLKLPTTESENAEKLTLRINKLLIYENIYDSKEVAIAELNVSFLIKRDDTYYEKFRAGILTKLESADVTNLHGRNIINALENCIKQYQARSNFFRDQELSKTELNENPLGKVTDKIFSVNKFSKGIYKTFADFRDNTPDNNTEFSIDYDKGATSIESATAVWLRNDLPFQGIWGFSDGKQVFINGLNKFYPLVKERDDFTVMLTKPNQVPVVSTYHTTGLTGGLLFNAMQYNRTELVYAKSDSGYKPNFKLDFSTGQLVPLNIEEIKPSGKVIIYLSKFSKAAEICDLFLNDKLVCTLKKGTYYEFKSNPGDKEVKVCIKNEKGETCQAIAYSLFNTDLYLAHFKKGAPVLERAGIIKKDILKEVFSGKLTRVGK